MWNWVGKLEELRRLGTPVAVVTVGACSGSSPREIGTKMLVLPSGEFFGTIGGGHLEKLAIADALSCLASGQARSQRYPLGASTGQCCGGVVELLVEVLNVGPRLWLFGAGHVGQAVSHVLQGTPFTVHAIDDREEWIGADATLPPGVVRHARDPEEFLDRLAAADSHGAYAAVMTHRHDLDQRLIERLLKLPLRYIGLIGSRGKWARFRQRLLARGVPEADLARVRCPLGLPLGGGKAPQEVALSLAAELLQLHYRIEEAVHERKNEREHEREREHEA